MKDEKVHNTKGDTLEGNKMESLSLSLRRAWARPDHPASAPVPRGTQDGLWIGSWVGAAWGGILETSGLGLCRRNEGGVMGGPMKNGGVSSDPGSLLH